MSSLPSPAIRSMLVHVDGTAASAARLEVARQLALRAESALCAMFVAAPPLTSAQLALAESPEALFQTVDWGAAGHAKTVFQEAAARGGPSMRWLESTGFDAMTAFMRQALYADLLVLGQYDASAAHGSAAPSGFVESALIDTGKPALVVPHTGSFETIGRDVLIGWNATVPAAHAVAAALPWLHGARHVHVVEKAGLQGKHADELDIAQYLRLHGITPTLHPRFEANVHAGGPLLSLATAVGADLLVMGCYGHSRAREFVLGGATRTVLHTMTLPVLMAH